LVKKRKAAMGMGQKRRRGANHVFRIWGRGRLPFQKKKGLEKRGGCRSDAKKKKEKSGRHPRGEAFAKKGLGK